MAIINLTPDSFYAPSRTFGDNALFAAEKAVKEGAAILDLGAQSTRPGYEEMSADEEIARLEIPLKRIKENFSVPVSVDTYFEKTARFALEAGADMINDVWGLSRSPNIAKFVAKHGASLCIMHNSQTPVMGDLFKNVLSFLKNSTDFAIKNGVEKERIVVDGGIGFAKDKKQNFELLNGYERLNILGFPTLLGCSRKSMFGGRVEERLPQTLSATELACAKGVLFVRVHDVKENAEVIKRFYGFTPQPQIF